MRIHIYQTAKIFRFVLDQIRNNYFQEAPTNQQNGLDPRIYFRSGEVTCNQIKKKEERIRAATSCYNKNRTASDKWSDEVLQDILWMTPRELGRCKNWTNCSRKKVRLQYPNFNMKIGPLNIKQYLQLSFLSHRLPNWVTGIGDWYSRL